MRYLTVNEVLDLYDRVMEQSGGAVGVRDFGALESALAQPGMTFAGESLHPTLAGKAAVLDFSLINNHPFLDGNKRIGHAAMEVFLILNGYEIEADVDEQEQLILNVAAGQIKREELAAWVKAHIVEIDVRERK